MSQQYLLHLPDGTQYGPVDRETLEAWSVEGRLPEETLVWPEGAPEWIGLMQALSAPATAPFEALVQARTGAAGRAGAGSRAAQPPTAAAAPAPTPAAANPAAQNPSASARSRAPAVASVATSQAAPARAARPAAAAPANRKGLLLAASGVAIVVLLVAGVLAVLRPYVATRRAIAEVRRYALADRRVVDAASGLTVELPGGWLALKGENPYVVRPSARLALAQPAAHLFGAVSTAMRPAMMDDLDAHLTELLQERLGRQPSQKEGARSDVQLGRGRGRMVRTTYEEDLAPMQGATVAWADGYALFALEAWGPAAAGDRFRSELESLCRGLLPSGATAGRVDAAVDQLAPQVPELSRDALRLLVAERLSQEKGVEDVPSLALRAVSRGLDALGAQEANEMRVIYQQIWEPVPEEQRVRLASLLSDVKAGREVAVADGQALREAVRAGVNALPEDQRARLQDLSGRAVRKSLLLP